MVDHRLFINKDLQRTVSEWPVLGGGQEHKAEQGLRQRADGENVKEQVQIWKEHKE